MRVQNNTHLTYCSNIHPGETWSAVNENLQQFIPDLKRELSPDAPFGIGLRLSDEASRSLVHDDVRRAFKQWMEENNLYVFTMNGFPFGGFHRKRVKDTVYQPDWRTQERVDYTCRLASILADLLPEGMQGGISTSPISYKPWLTTRVETEETLEAGARHLAEVTAHLTKLHADTGRFIHIDIEPEPDCLIENTPETIAFFKDWLLSTGARHLSKKTGYTIPEAERALRSHIQLCYDTCHFAVEFEEPAEAIQQILDAGMKLGKIQISAAVRVPLPDAGTERSRLAERLNDFVESTYLHQVIEKRIDGTLHHYNDLHLALPEIMNREANEWRIHFHVPVFVDTFGMLHSTRSDITKTLEVVLPDHLCHHLEMETYTWEVLPQDLKQDMKTSILREYQWVLSQIQ